MQVAMIFRLLSILYKTYLRQVLIAAIDDPDSEIDDFIVGLVDAIFEFQLPEDDHPEEK